MSSEVSKRYSQRGVSASKEDVHNAIKNVEQIMCICSSVHYASNVLEMVIDKKGLLSIAICVMIS